MDGKDLSAGNLPNELENDGRDELGPDGFGGSSDEPKNDEDPNTGAVEDAAVKEIDDVGKTGKGESGKEDWRVDSMPFPLDGEK